MKRIAFKVVIVLALLLAGFGAFLLQRNYKQAVGAEVTDFASCAAAGNPVMETYPEQCVSKDGRHFTKSK